MTPTPIPVSPDGHELADLLAELVAALPPGGRTLLGLAGEPGAGKSTIAGRPGRPARSKRSVVRTRWTASTSPTRS